MPRLTLNRSETDSNNLPRLCMRCGAPAESTDRKQFAWHPQWVWLLLFAGLLPLLIVALIMTKRMWVEAPFCAQHRSHWTRRKWLTIGSLLCGIVLGAFILIAGSAAPNSDKIMGWACGATIFIGLAWFAFVIVLQTTSIEAREITDTHITLNRVADTFVQAVDQQRTSRPRLWGDQDFMVRRPTSSSMTGILIILGIMAAGLVLIVCLGAITFIGKQANSQFAVVGGGMPVVDAGNNFRLNQPGGRWQLLTPEGARQVNQLASAGASNKIDDFVGLVIVESAGAGSQIAGREQEVARLMVDDCPLEDKRMESVKPVTFQGQPAVRYRFTAKVGTSRGRIENTIFIYKGKLYQLFVTGPGGTTNVDKEFQTFVNAFQLLP